MTFEDMELMVCRRTDDILGDVIQLKIPPAAVFTPVKGYVIVEHAGFDMTGPSDPLRAVKRVKLRKELLPAPARDVRLQSPKLGTGAFQIAGDPEDGPIYWMLDIQKVAA